MELLTHSLNFYFSTFELLTQNWKMKNLTSSYEVEAEKEKVSLRVNNSKLKINRWLNSYFITFELLTRGWKIKMSTLSY